MQFGTPGQGKGSNDTENFGRVAKIFVDPKANEAYIADGYGNKRVVVIDADTGKFKRYWGAYGNKPDDTNLGPYNPNAPPAQQFRIPVHCAELSNDGLRLRLRSPERSHPGVQAGRHVREGAVHREEDARRRLGVGHRVLEGSAAEVPVPRRRQEREDLRHAMRETLEILTSFGDGGRQPGQFFAVHSIATDSKGNIYTTETYEGRRAAEVRLQGPRAGDEEGPGHGMAEVASRPRAPSFPSTSPNTATAFCISSIVPNEMRQCVFSNGGKSRATRTPLVLHASRKSFAGRPMLTNMKLACESVGFMPRSANHFIVKSRTALLRARSAAMNDGSCSMAAIPACIASTLSELVPDAAVPVGHLLDRVRVADRVAHAQARHAVGLRERARDDDARVLDGERNVRVVIRDR